MITFSLSQTKNTLSLPKQPKKPAKKPQNSYKKPKNKKDINIFMKTFAKNIRLDLYFN
jgi:hypothetical protein